MPPLHRKKIDIIRKCPARIGGELVFYFADERPGKIFSLLFADAGNAAELAGRGRIISRHFAERHIGKNDAGRDIAVVGESAAQPAKLFEKQFVVLDRAGSRFFIFRADVDLALKHHLQARESAEAREGISALNEKRKPNWSK